MAYGKPYNPEYEAQAILVERLWARIKEEFATRKDVLALAKQVQRLDQAPVVQAIQTGDGGPISAVGSDNTIHLKYENWVEGEATDAAGNRVLTYNSSQNALTAAAAAMVIKQIRAEVSKVQNFSVQVCDHVDIDGHPIVPTVSFTTLYLTPAGDEDNNSWNEWIAVQKPAGASSRYPYRWERVGSKEIDLKWVKDDIAGLNEQIKKLENRLNKSTKTLGDAILNRAIRPLQDLKDYINSPQFISYVFEQMPRAGMGTDGLMSANSFAILNSIAIWASNDHKVMGGGAMSADVVIKMFDKVGVPTDTLKDKYLRDHDMYGD